MQTRRQYEGSGSRDGDWLADLKRGLRSKTSGTAMSPTGGRSTSLRLLAIVCLLLVVAMSTVQVCHVHAAATSRQGSRPGNPVPEDRCPLCVTMHSALPTGIHVAPEPVVAVRVLDSAAADAERMFRWRFEMASRPPPAA